MLRHPETLLARIQPLSGVVFELLGAIRRENVSAADLGVRIGRDPVLAARLLKIVNSPFYGAAGRIGSLEEAAVLVGTSTVRALVLASSRPRLQDDAVEEKPGLAGIRRHSYSCGLWAQALAPEARVDPAVAFTAGLLHDIGRLALLSADPGRYAQVAQGRRGQNLQDAERDVLGCTHSEFGASLLKTWRLPEEIVQAVADHHRSDDRPRSPLSDLVQLADMLAHTENGERNAGVEVAGHLEKARLRLGLPWHQIEGALAQVARQLDGFDAALLRGRTAEGRLDVDCGA